MCRSRHSTFGFNCLILCAFVPGSAGTVARAAREVARAVAKAPPALQRQVLRQAAMHAKLPSHNRDSGGRRFRRQSDVAQNAAAAAAAAAAPPPCIASDSSDCNAPPLPPPPPPLRAAPARFGIGDRVEYNRQGSSEPDDPDYIPEAPGQCPVSDAAAWCGAEVTGRGTRMTSVWTTPTWNWSTSCARANWSGPTETRR